ncbi:hypothetical protein CL619_01410 [archaeon]|nr:hypothetical protein [archaeon]|tara:strand:+ start:3278 stop:3661 length:384 start_codon:yes stop_codon:yes gene_type:complete
MNDQKINSRVLISDDEERIVRIFSRMLNGEGWTIDSAANGLELKGKIDALYEDPSLYDVILTDNDMPGKKGIECVRHARSLGIKTPIYVMSGKPVEQEALQAGATGFFYKPFDIEEVLEVLSQYIRE